MLKETVENALGVLIGQKLSDSCRCANMEMFSLGEIRERTYSSGKVMKKSEYALHVSCPWRIIGPNGIVVGYEDRFMPANEGDEWLGFDEDKGRTRCEAALSELIDGHRDDPICVQSVVGDELGGFRLSFSHDLTLEVFPDTSRKDYEHWRFFQIQKSPHFVMTGAGVRQ
jgi:hypothetical protein